MKVVFSERAFTALLSETYEKIKTETGGILLGYYDSGVWYVVEAIDPGPDSVFEVAYFEYDRAYVTHLINKVARLYKRDLSLVGLWHRHPGSFDVFSGTDDKTNLEFASRSPVGAISALVNIDPKFRLTVYHVSAHPQKYARVQYEVGDSLFPAGALDLHPVSEYLSYIDTYAMGGTRNAPLLGYADLTRLVSQCLSPFDASAYVSEIKSAEESDTFVDELSDVMFDDLDFLTTTLKMRLNVVHGPHNIRMHDATAKNVNAMYFSKIESLNKYVLVFENRCYEYNSGMLAELIKSKANGGDERWDKIRRALESAK